MNKSLKIVFIFITGPAAQSRLCLRNFLVRAWRNGRVAKSKSLDICK